MTRMNLLAERAHTCMPRALERVVTKNEAKRGGKSYGCAML